MALVVDDVVELGNDKAEVSFSINFASTADSFKPRLVDIVLEGGQPFELVSVVEGASMVTAGRRLFPFAGNRGYSRQKDGGYRFFAFTSAAAPRIGDGTILKAKAVFAGSVGVFRLQRRDDVFAPSEANEQVQQTHYDSPVVVLR